MTITSSKAEKILALQVSFTNEVRQSVNNTEDDYSCRYKTEEFKTMLRMK